MDDCRTTSWRMYRTLGLASALLLASSVPAAGADYFSLTVKNKVTGQPLAGVTFSTTNAIVYTSSATGQVRTYEPGVMGTNVYFGFAGCNKPSVNGVIQCNGTCSNNGAVACDTDADCNNGYEPPHLPFFGSHFAGMVLNLAEQGMVTVEMCPDGTQGPGDGCTGPAATCQMGTPTGPSAPAPVPTPAQMFRITVVDSVSNRGVPIAEVRSPNETYYVDSGGVVAFYDAALMGTSVHFDLAAHGYAAASTNLPSTPGGSAQVSLVRTMVAERLYRITGGGNYRDTVLMGLTPPTANPVINGRVFGQDGGIGQVYQNKIFWLWGDTTKPSGPLGNFKTTCATSDLPGQGGLDPAIGVNLSYYLDPGSSEGFVKQMCAISNPPGNTNPLVCWMGALSTATNAQSTEKLYATYNLGGFTPAKTGWARFNDATTVFDELSVFTGSEAVTPGGHTFKVRHGSTPYLYAGNPMRLGATEAAILNTAGYEAFTAFVQGSTTQIDRNPDGTIRYTWKTGTKTISASLGGSLIASNERLYGHLQDPDTGFHFNPHAYTIDWNPYRRRYLRITGEAPFFINGDNWFTEADTPMGPWVYSREVVTHNNYNTYNPIYHPFLDRLGGREMIFEITYTNWLAAVPPTPRHNYNQVMYRLDLADSRVVLPVPVYDLAAGGSPPGNFVTKSGIRSTTTDTTAVFFAPDRSGASGTVPVYWSDAACAPRQLVVGGTPTTTPLFYALPGNASPLPTTTPLYDYANGSTGQHAYSTNGSLSLSGFTRAQDPIAHVWVNPLNAMLPVKDYLAPLVADSGTDHCQREPFPGGGRDVVLNGSASSHSSGTITSYAWSWTGGSATGVSPTVHLAVGLYDITLTTTGSDGATSTDNVVVNITPCPSGCCS